MFCPDLWKYAFIYILIYSDNPIHQADTKTAKYSELHFLGLTLNCKIVPIFKIFMVPSKERTSVFSKAHIQ